MSISDQGEFIQSSWRWLIDGPMLLPFPALFVRRLHDQDKSGWWSLLLLALIIGSVVFGEDFPGQTDQSIWLVLTFGILLVALLILSFWHGSDGENRFGPDPRVEGAV